MLLLIYRLATGLALLALAALSVSPTQVDVRMLPDRAAFQSAAEPLTALDLDGLAPPRGFRLYRGANELRAGGARFRVTGGAKFGPGSVTLMGEGYSAGPLYPSDRGALLVWAPPNQPGNAFLEVEPPAGTTAVSASVWTAQPFVSTVEVGVEAAGGPERTFTLRTLPRPDPAFLGVTSDREMTRVRLRLPKGQVALILDDIAFGRSSPSEAPDVPARFRPPAGSDTPDLSAARPAGSPPRTAPQDAAGGGGDRAAGAGVIAYVRGGTEIHVIQPDGTGDRLLWKSPRPEKTLGITGLAWRPDGRELAFASSHEAATSLYDSDLYAIRPDGTGLRKLTNPPMHSAFARYPHGTVTVKVRNSQTFVRNELARSGVFMVYVAGAPAPRQVTLPLGSSKTLVFRDVADFGAVGQAVVAIWGRFRWFIPGVDVQAGKTVGAPEMAITGDGIELLGAYRPVWRSDGSRISYRTGVCTLNSVPVNPRAGEFVYQPLFSGKHPLGTCAWDWGPTPTLTNQLIYTENASGDSSIYRIAEGGRHPGTKLTAFTDIEYQMLLDLRWLPDGSGLLYTNKTLFNDTANLFRFDFATRQVTPVTRFEKEFARQFSVSPDGRWIVFERGKSSDEDDPADLWIMKVDGSDPRLLVKDALRPAWGRAASGASPR